MTKDDKQVVGKLLEGCRISALSPDCIRILDVSGNPVMKVTHTFFGELRPILRRKKKDLLFLIDLRKVRSLHGNSFIKKLYKGKATIPDKQNTPPRKGKEAKDSGVRSNALLIF